MTFFYLCCAIGGIIVACAIKLIDKHFEKRKKSSYDFYA